MRSVSVMAAALLMAPLATAQDSAPTTAPTSTPTTAPTAGETHPFAAAVEAAHGGAAWRAHSTFACDLTVAMGGETRIDGRLIYDHHGSRVRIEQADGTVLVFDGERAWVSPADSEFPMARFHVLTWPYFLAAPFKLSDPGASLEDTGEMLFHGEPHPTARLTFGEGVGDAPEDWYLIYIDPESGLVDAMAYIVTYFSGGDDGEREAHSIVYHDYEDVDGAKISTRWTFQGWSEEEGPTGEARGTAMISSPNFMTPEPGTFDAPENAREDALPGN